MFKEMKKPHKKMTTEESIELLQNTEYCTLATYGEDGWPYAVPLSYILLDGKIYFHCLVEGHKLDNIKNDDKVCVNVVDDTEPLWDDDYTTYFKSVTVFGIAKLLEEGELKTKVLKEIVIKYLPDYLDRADKIIEDTKNATAVVEISIEHMCGKTKRRK